MSTTTKFANPGNGWANRIVFQMSSKSTFAVPSSLHKVSCKKLCQYFENQLNIRDGLILIQGGEQECLYDSDTEVIFKQNSWFQYLFGVKEPSFSGLINISTKKRILIIPRLPSEYQLWCGKIQSPEYFQQMYDVDEVIYDDQLLKWLSEQIQNLSKTSSNSSFLYLLKGTNSDSQSICQPFKLPDNHNLHQYINDSEDILHHALSTIRVTKSNFELELLKYSNYVASNAHVAVMSSVKPDQMEYELEALFQYHIYKHGGCRHVAYTSICACGPNAATLHYGHAGAPNNRQLKVNDIALLDMGASYHGYCSDITCSVSIYYYLNYLILIQYI